MLSKSFKSNKFYQVTRYTFKYGNEWNEMENTVTVWDTLEKAKAYIDRYAKGLKFASAEIEVNNLDREITCDDYKKGQYNVVSFQKIYDVTLDGTEDETAEEIIYMTGVDEELTSENVGGFDNTIQINKSANSKEVEPFYSVFPTEKTFKTFEDAKYFAEKFAPIDKINYSICKITPNSSKLIGTVKPPIKYFIVKDYTVQFSNLRAAINFAKGINAGERLIIYAVRSMSDSFLNNLEPVCSVPYQRHYLIKEGENNAR